MILLDTDILVDVLRGNESAKSWLQSLETESFGIPGMVARELVMGCRDRADLQRIEKLLKRFKVIWHEANEFARAYDLLASHRLASGLSIPDCLIAAMALARDAQLYTFNSRHFALVPGLRVREPYSRSANRPHTEHGE